jgi:ribosomal protein S27AE
MFMPCPTCKTDVEPGVDKATLQGKKVVATTKAVCPNCKTDLKVSSFMISALAKLGQYHSQQTTREAFSFECKTCDKVLPAILSKDKKKALCGKCNNPLSLSEMMIKAMSVARNGSIDSSR